MICERKGNTKGRKEELREKRKSGGQLYERKEGSCMRKCRGFQERKGKKR